MLQVSNGIKRERCVQTDVVRDPPQLMTRLLRQITTSLKGTKQSQPEKNVSIHFEGTNSRSRLNALGSRGEEEVTHQAMIPPHLTFRLKEGHS